MINSSLKKSLGLLAFAVLSISPAHAFTGGDYIIGGVTVEQGDPVLRSTVLLFDGSYLCTGSIVAPDLIISAAHCVLSPINVSAMKVYFTTNIEDQSAYSVGGLSAIANPLYNPRASKNANDVSLIKFPGGLPAGYAPAQILPPSVKLQNGESVVLAGYGESDTSEGGNNGAGVLRKVNVNIENADYSTSEVLLDQTQGKGSCHGDSGGPAFVEMNGGLYLWGVTSRAYPNNQDAAVNCDQGAIYTEFDAQGQFINQAQTELEQGTAPAPTSSTGTGTKRHR